MRYCLFPVFVVLQSEDSNLVGSLMEQEGIALLPKMI
jgi:hypothetical protein